MSLFLTDDERAMVLAKDRSSRLGDFHWALMRRVERRASSPGLYSGGETVDWWRPVGEYLTDAAMVHAIKPSELTAVWLRDVTLSLVRRPADDWVGPHYRNHTPCPDGSLIGHLETAHFCWATAAVLDLAGDVFTPAEREEVAGVLRDRGAKMCVNWLDRPHTVANWWCVLTAGLTVAAAVLDDEKLLERARLELSECSKVLQPDGSYAESLQYGNYAIYTLMLASEALRRRGEDVEAIAPVSGYAGYARWAAASYLYSKPTTGWGPASKPRSLNFNDSGAVFKPTADVLLHLATRAVKTNPKEAGLARWLFEQAYAHDLAQGPDDQASFGLRTDWGFLTLPLLPQACEAISPTEAGLDPAQSFDCGNSIARDSWGGKTVLAMHGGGTPMNGPGHLHHDLNSIILVHNNQRLLVDAGHSCYRNTMRKLEVSTELHNTCTFHVSKKSDERMESWMLGGMIEQQEPGRRSKRGDKIDSPVERGGTRLITAFCDEVRVMGSESAESYGEPIKRFARFSILCGSHAVFVVDHIVASRPVRTQWNWLVNNRDGELDLKIAGRDRVVARRGDAGMKLFSLSGGSVGQYWAHINDAYHCMPGQMGEGRPGSAHLLQWVEPAEALERIGIHAMAVDGYGAVAGWHLRQEGDRVGLESPGGGELWMIEAKADRITIRQERSGRGYEVRMEGEKWVLVKVA